jgi:hypothetical protein
MERYQIYLDPAQRKELQRLAERKGCNVSQVIRDAVDAYVEHEAQAELPPLERVEDHPLWALITMADEADDPSLPRTHGSTDYRETLYGGDHPWP